MAYDRARDLFQTRHVKMSSRGLKSEVKKSLISGAGSTFKKKKKKGGTQKENLTPKSPTPKEGDRPFSVK